MEIIINFRNSWFSIKLFLSSVWRVWRFWCKRLNHEAQQPSLFLADRSNLQALSWECCRLVYVFSDIIFFFYWTEKFSYSLNFCDFPKPQIKSKWYQEIPWLSRFPRVVQILDTLWVLHSYFLIWTTCASWNAITILVMQPAYLTSLLISLQPSPQSIQKKIFCRYSMYGSV